MLYRGEARATALGILFGVFGAATMVAPALVSVFGPGGPEIQAFALCAAAALLGVWATRRWLPDLPGALPYQRLLIATTALWAFGVFAAVDGLVQAEPWLVLSAASSSSPGSERGGSRDGRPRRASGSDRAAPR